jgi:phosphohistidine phosphatase
MNLYLVQHGEAKTKAEDPERPLTQPGADVVASMAAWAAKVAIEVDQVRHSGKRRAQQTAEILADAIAPSRGVVSVSDINPNDDVAPWAETLTKENRSVMLVGHLPFLNRLASLLLVADPAVEVIRFHNAGIVCLTHEENRWSLRWVVTPDLVGGFG